jgi:phage host-nuclease inhibitor protein Gam
MPKTIEDVLFGSAPDQFKVSDADSLAWALRKLRAAEQEIEKAKRQRDEWIKKINEWYGEETKAALATSTKMRALIQEYQLLTGKKTIKHPLGTLTARTSKKIEVKNEEAFIEWAKSTGNTQFIRTKEEINKKDVRALIVQAGTEVYSKETGELIPGVAIQEETHFKVSFTEDEE